MRAYRSAMGKTVDMAALVSKNENVRAVGNMKVNARGDTIDVHGKVIQPVTERVTNKYSQTVGNKTAQAKTSTPPAPVKPKIEEELTLEEKELENSLEEDLEIEKIKAEELKKNGR